jgi:WD40 repeat protein
VYLATAGMDSVVRIWKVEDGTLVITLEGPSEDILWVKWHTKGDVVLAGSTDMSVWMWNVPTGNCMAVFSGHSGSVNAGAFTSDGKHVLTCSQDCSARLWNPKDSQCLVTMHDPKGAGTFHLASITCLDTRDDLLLTGSEDATTMLTHMVFGGPDTLPTAKVVSILKHHEDAVESVAFFGPEPFFATGGCV